MKILMYPHSLRIGGVQIIATNLAAGLKDLGHEVILFAPPGPLAGVAASRGVRVIEQDLWNGRRPSARAAWMLKKVAHAEHVDVVHAHTHSTSLEAFFGPYALQGVPLVCSDLGTRLPHPFPGSVPFIACTRQLYEEARRSKTGPLYLLSAPVDTDEDHPSVDASGFLQEHRLSNNRLNVVLVSRLAIPLKAEGLIRAVDAVRVASEQLPVRLVIVGGGALYQELRVKADEINRRLRERVIVTIGPMLDPRPAYAAADVVIGMGTSILRGMAFEKPAICLGVGGFSEVVMPSTLDHFLTEGYFGVGSGESGSERLYEQLMTLLTDGSLRRELGRFSRKLVSERYSLTTATRSLERIYEEVGSQRSSPGRRIFEVADFATRVVRRKFRKAVQARA